MMKYFVLTLVMFSGCALKLPGVDMQPGLQKCVEVKMEEGSLSAGPVSFVGKGIEYRSHKSEWCGDG